MPATRGDYQPRSSSKGAQPASLPSFVCDPCERKTGEEVDADTRCAECGDDLCAGCTHLYECADGLVDLCERCWRKAIGRTAAPTRRGTFRDTSRKV